jgi:hypothetical protein
MSKGSSYSDHQSCHNTYTFVEGIFFHCICTFLLHWTSLIPAHFRQENTPPPSLFCLPTITLPSLRHLAIDVRPTSDVTAVTLSSLLVSLTSLSTLVLKFADHQLPIWSSVIDLIAPPNAVTMPLKRLALMDCAVSTDIVGKLSSRCKELEVLEVPLPIKEIVRFFCLQRRYIITGVVPASLYYSNIKFERVAHVDRCW